MSKNRGGGSNSLSGFGDLDRLTNKIEGLPNATPEPPKTGLSKFVASRGFTAVLRLETAGRKGKTATVIMGLPKNELFLKEMTTQLKSRCGAGGSYDLSAKDGVVEIQGDQREKIRVYLASENITFKG